MWSALFNGCLGVALALGIGIGVLGWSAEQVLVAVLASELGGFIALWVTLRAERVHTLRRHFINRSLKTWAFFLTLYFGTILLISSPMRDLRAWLYMTIPLMLGNGFIIILFGPIQDARVRAEQRRALSK